MESILIFGAGDNQLTLIKGAKNLGYQTVVIDPNPYAIGKGFADIFEVVPSKDYELTKKIAQKYKVGGIVTCQMENPLLLMAKLAEEMSFNFPTVLAIEKARDKYLMKKAFINANVPCAKGFLLSSVDEINESEISLPVIIKPLDAFSSRGVFKINKFEEIAIYFPISSSFSSNKTVIVEEFIEGPEYSIESVTNNGITYVIQITEKEITPFPNTVELAHIQPANISNTERLSIELTTKDAIKALGLDNCATHTELKLTKQGPKMIEIGARLGGDYITSHLVPLSTGISIEKLTIQIAMNNFKGIPQQKENGAIIRYLNLDPNRTVESIGNWKELINEENLEHFDIVIKEGEMTSAITDSAKRAGFVIVKGKNRDEAISNADYYIRKLESLIKLK